MKESKQPRFFIWAAFISLVIYSCNQSNPKDFDVFIEDLGMNVSEALPVNNADYETIRLPESIDRSIPMSELIDSLWYIRLETHDNALIGNISKILYHENRYYIFDRTQTGSLFIFDSAGKFLNQIAPKGRGPGEFVKAENFVINSKENVLEITDHSLHKIFCYNTQGDFLYDKNLYFYFYDYQYLDTLAYISTYHSYNIHFPQIDNYKFLVGSSEFDSILYVGLPYDVEKERKYNFGALSSLYPTSNQVLLHEPLSDTIYEIRPTEVRAKYVFDFHKFKVPEDMWNYSSTEKFLEKYLDSPYYALFPGEIIDNRRFLYFRLIFNGKNIMLFYDKVSKEVFGGSMLDNTEMKNAIFFTPPISQTEEAFISVLQASDIYNYSQEWSRNPDIRKYRSDEIIEFCKETKINDNPVLMHFTLKTNMKWKEGLGSYHKL